VIIGGVYCEWLVDEVGIVDKLAVPLKAATIASRHVAVLGNFNINMLRGASTKYSFRVIAVALLDAVKTAGLKYHATPYTWRSHDLHGQLGKHQFSCLDHVYSCGLVADVKVLPDATTDHRPVLVSVAQTSRPRPRLNYSSAEILRES
jgi:hypothetical protein